MELKLKGLKHTLSYVMHVNLLGESMNITKQTVLLWVFTLCRLIGRYQHFKETETLVSTYKSTWNQNPEGKHDLHYHENLKSHIIKQVHVAVCKLVFWKVPF
jgi:hypothetical protein